MKHIMPEYISELNIHVCDKIIYQKLENICNIETIVIRNNQLTPGIPHCII